ncbi:hypothetical protein QCA50_003643 [Cerrena zonata]|uniref:Uncharacterized protein n=1 Tax=Cerrena zonata TaxID=2478898 RepID=A0AAW0GQ90_9APHY
MKMDNKIRSNLVINAILCNEFFDELMEELNENGDKDTVKYFGMPKCPNDLEFDLVRQKLGVPRLSPSYSDDDMDEDSDPDDDDDI